MCKKYLSLTFFGDFDLKKSVIQSEIMYRTQQNFSPNKDSVSGKLGLSLLLLVPTREDDEAFEWKQGVVFSHCSNTVISCFPTMHQNGNIYAVVKVSIDGHTVSN